MCTVVEDHVRACRGHGHDGAGGAVEHSAGRVDVGVQQDAVTGAVGAGFGTPAGTAQGRAAQLSLPDEGRADAVGEVFAVSVTDGQHRDVVAPEAVAVAHGRLRQRLARLRRGGEFVFPTVLGSDGAAVVDRASAQLGQGLTVCGMLLSTIHP